MSFGRCLGLTMRRLRGEEGAWGSGLFLMMRGWGRLRRWVFFSFFVFYLMLIEVVAFLDPIIAHDSEGSEAEKQAEVDLVRKFIDSRSRAKDINQKLHLVWSILLLFLGLDMLS